MDIVIIFLIHHNVRYTDKMIHGANMGPTRDRRDSGGPHGGHVDLAIWVYNF